MITDRIITPMSIDEWRRCFVEIRMMIGIEYGDCL